MSYGAAAKNIAAVEVESALQTHRDVVASAVCAVADEVRGEEVFAFVVVRRGGRVVGHGNPAAIPLPADPRLLQGAGVWCRFAACCRRPPRRSWPGADQGARRRGRAVGTAFDLKHLKKRTVRGATKDYAEVVLAAPVTVPYVRHSIRNGHWFVAQALARLIKESGIDKEDIDGLSLGSFTLAPDTSIGVTQHLGVTLRWLDHVPLGGACGIVALRRALRAVQSGDAEVVACIGADTNHVDSFRQSLGSFSVFARDAVAALRIRGSDASFAFSDLVLHAAPMARRGKTSAKSASHNATTPCAIRTPCSRRSSRSRST